MPKGTQRCFKCGGKGIDYTTMAMPSGFATKCKTCQGTGKCTKEDNEWYMDHHYNDGDTALATIGLAILIFGGAILLAIYG